MLRYLILIPTLSLSLISAIPVLAAEGVGEVAYATGEAWMLRGNVRQVVETGMILQRNDEIVTGTDGRVKLFMEDGSKLYVSPRSRISLREYALREKNMFAASVDMLWGRARFWVNKLVSQDSSFSVRTTTAVLGVRGTEFLVLSPPTPELLRRQFERLEFDALPRLPSRMALISGLVDVTTFKGVKYRLTPGKTIDVDSSGNVRIRPVRESDFEFQEPPTFNILPLPPSPESLGQPGEEVPPAGTTSKGSRSSGGTDLTEMTIKNAIQNLGSTTPVRIQPGFVVP